jgi:hypothetical protein
MEVNTVLYQCTNLTSGIIAYNEKVSKAHRQLESDITQVQEAVAEIH